MSFGMKMPNYSAQMKEQMEESARARSEARSQDLEDRVYFRGEAEKERKLQEEREARRAARIMKEEKRRIGDLAEEEASAAEEAEAMTTVTDRDQGFGNMFASLLRGFQGGQSNFISGGSGGTSGTKGMRKYSKLPTSGS